MKKSIPILVIVLLLAAGGAYYVLNNKDAATSNNPVQTEQNKMERAELDALFQVYLDNFKEDLRKRAEDYKESRRVLSDLTSAYNFETVDYASENYKMFNETLAPSMRKQASEIIDVFQKYSNDLKNDLKEADTEIAKDFLIKWEKMSNQQLNDYVDFFALEEERLQVYEELIKFYYTHINRYEIDFDKNEFVFNNEKDRKRHEALLSQLDSLQKDSNDEKDGVSKPYSGTAAVFTDDAQAGEKQKNTPADTTPTSDNKPE